jgi:UMF1 family MFS transporter
VQRPPLLIPAGPAPTREKLAWCAFDFANSSFTTVITTVVYAPYFATMMVGKVGYLGQSGDTWWALAQAIAQALVIVSAPWIGARADHLGSKKPHLLASYAACVASTALLSALPAGATLPALLLVVVATLAFSTGENLVAGFLPELASPGEMGRLSALGWSLGYFGGLLSLALALLLVQNDLLSLVPLATALFFAAAGLPTFLVLRERAVRRPGPVPPARALFVRTWGERRLHRDLVRFLAAITCFQAGIAVVIALASIFAQDVVGLAQDEVILLFVALQLAAAVGAGVFGQWQDRAGSRSAVLASLGLWILAALLCGTASGRTQFFLGAVLAGAAMGGTQSASRAVIGLFCPAGREAEWFGLWGVATKAAAVLGLCAYALGRQALDQRTSILGTILFFVAGAAVMATVDVERGRRAASAVAASAGAGGLASAEGEAGHEQQEGARQGPGP